MKAPHRFAFAWLLLLPLLGCTPAKPTFKGTDVTGIEWGGDIALQAHTGQRVSTADFRGKLLVLFFGYTHCPDICGPTLAKLAHLRQALGPDAERLQVIFVTVDPARDTPEQLAAYLAKFHPSFVGLRGSPEELTAAAREYKVLAQPVSGHAGGQPDPHAAHAPKQMAVLIEHSGTLFVKDAAGRLRLLWKNDTPVADMEHDVRLLLRSAGG